MGTRTEKPKITHVAVDEDTVTKGHTHTHTHTNYVEREVAVAADVPGCILGAAVVHAVVIWAGTLKGECPLFVVDLMALLCQLHTILEPLACRPEREERV